MVFNEHRGHGKSGSADPATYTIDQLGHDLDTILRTLAPTGPVVLVGHSMGAMVAFAYACLFPETVGIRVIGVGLETPGPPPVRTDRARDRFRYATGESAAGRAGHRHAQQHPATDHSAFPGLADPLRRDPTLRLLADLPVLVLGGSADILIPFAHSGVLGGAEPVRLDGAGHSVILERAQEVAAAVAALVDRAAKESAQIPRAPVLTPEPAAQPLAAVG